VILAAISATTVITVVSALATVIAAGATVVAVLYARKTVFYARKTVTESEQAAQSAAERHTEQVHALDLISASAHAAHENEMRERKLAFDHDVWLRSLAQLQRVAQVLRELIDAAREERAHPSERILDIQRGRAISSTPVQMLQVQLRIEVRVLKALGGPDLTEVIPGIQRDDQPAGLQRLWFEGVTALEKITGYIDVFEATRPSTYWQVVDHYSKAADEQAM
jgi:hypothetical protein